jgi:hypothetical protein
VNAVRFIATTIEVGGTALWVGASAGFAFVSAPLAFGLVTDRDVFAELTERTLARLANVTYAAGGAATIVALLRAAFDGAGRMNDAARAVAGISALACIAYHERAIVPSMTRAQAELGGSFKTVSEDDPKRIAYRALHRRSTRAYGTALMFGVAQLTLGATRSNTESPNVIATPGGNGPIAMEHADATGSETYGSRSND